MVAVDTVASYILGFDPAEITYLEMAAQAGIGCNRMKDLVIYMVENGLPVRASNIESLRVNPPFRVIMDIIGEVQSPFGSINTH